MGTAVAVREVAASWCLDTRAPSVDEEERFLRSSRHVVGEWSTYLGAGPDDVENAVLVTSELVTNAIQHGRAPYELHLHEVPDGLRWSVIDAGLGQLAIRTALGRALWGEGSLDAETGRGLVLVVRLFPGCGVRTAVNAYGDPATEVSFTLPCAVPAPAA